MDHRSGGPPPPPRGKRTPAYQDDHRLEPSAGGAGYHVPRRLGERELDRSHDRAHPEDIATVPTSRNILAETPETTVGENVHVKGELSFERLLRVDGSFKGHLISTGDLVIGATGVVRGNIEHLREVLSDGIVIGDIQAEKIWLRRSAIVIGNITCISLSMDPDVSVSGKLNVHKEAPDRLHLEGEEEAPEDEVADSSENTNASDSKNSDGDKQRRSSKKEASSKKESGSVERDRRPKEDKGKDEPRKKKEGESSKSKTSSK